MKNKKKKFDWIWVVFWITMAIIVYGIISTLIFGI